MWMRMRYKDNVGVYVIMAAKVEFHFNVNTAITAKLCSLYVILTIFHLETDGNCSKMYRCLN